MASWFLPVLLVEQKHLLPNLAQHLVNVPFSDYKLVLLTSAPWINHPLLSCVFQNMLR